MTPRTELLSLSLHDALPISVVAAAIPLEKSAASSAPSSAASFFSAARPVRKPHRPRRGEEARDRKSTRLNSSHSQISYAVFCLKKKIQQNSTSTTPFAT